MNYYKSRLFHTFFLTTMTFSAGIYKNGNRNLQLKLPVPSRDLEKIVKSWRHFRRSLPENNRSNQSNQSNGSKLSRGANENPKEIRPHSLKRGKTRATKSRLVLVWKLSGRENGASFLDQLHSEVKQTQRNPWLLSIIYQSINLRDKGKTKDSRKSGPYVKLFRFVYN